jgi:hypothetical protein
MRRFRVTKDIWDEELALQEEGGKWVAWKDVSHLIGEKDRLIANEERLASVLGRYKSAIESIIAHLNLPSDARDDGVIRQIAESVS